MNRVVITCYRALEILANRLFEPATFWLQRVKVTDIVVHVATMFGRAIVASIQSFPFMDFFFFFFEATVDQDQPTRTCSLILLCTRRFLSLISFNKTPYSAIKLFPNKPLFLRLHYNAFGKLCDKRRNCS